jgi:hypothetical protein
LRALSKRSAAAESKLEDHLEALGDQVRELQRNSGVPVSPNTNAPERPQRIYISSEPSPRDNAKAEEAAAAVAQEAATRAAEAARLAAVEESDARAAVNSRAERMWLERTLNEKMAAAETSAKNREAAAEDAQVRPCSIHKSKRALLHLFLSS